MLDNDFGLAYIRFVKKPPVNLRLIFFCDTVLLVFSILIFSASAVNTTQWLLLRGFRFCGTLTLFLGLAFFLLTSMELYKPPRKKNARFLRPYFFSWPWRSV